MHYTLDDTIRQLEDSPSYFENSAGNGERALWRAIIVQALMDAASRSRKADVLFHKHEALTWLEGGSRDFAIVCECAGFNPSYIRRMAKRALQAGCKWRAEPGEGRKGDEHTSQPATPPEEDRPPCAVILAFPIAARCVR